MTEQTALRDYVRVLRRHARFLVTMTIFGIGLAVGYSLLQETRYAASASLSLEDENRALRALGTAAGPASTAEERATLGAKTIVSPDVVKIVSKRMDLTRSVPDVRRAIEVTPDAASSLIFIEARAGDAQSAANLANTVARVASEQQTERERSELNAAAKRLQERLRGLRANDPSRIVFAERISQIEAVASIARPVSVASLATVPKSPASPKPVRNATIGGAVGLLLALCLALTRSSFDRRLRGDDDLRAVLDLPIVGHVPNEVLGQLGFAANGNRSPNMDDLEPFRIIRANLDSLDIDRKIRSIAVTSALAEEGKSTVAASLAVSFAIAGRRTLLLECDLRRPVLAERMDLPKGPGLAEYLTGKAKREDVLRTVTLRDTEGDDEPVASESELVCVFAGQSPRNPAELLDTQRFEEFLKTVSKEFEIVIVDTPPLLLVADTREILPSLDGVLLCARMSQTTREQAAAAGVALQNLPPMSAGVVATGIMQGDETEGYYYGYGNYK